MTHEFARTAQDVLGRRSKFGLRMRGALSEEAARPVPVAP